MSTLKEMEIEELRRATADYCDILRNMPTRTGDLVSASIRLHVARGGPRLTRAHVRASKAAERMARKESP